MDHAYLSGLGHLAVDHGVTHWGVAPAGILQRARQALVDRAEAGLADTMQFTYRNPQRSTDPSQAVRGAQAVFVAALPYPADADEHAPTGQSGPDGAGPSGPPWRGEIARYAWADHGGTLRRALAAVVERLRADRFRAVAVADDNSLVDREAAYLAGLGWYGKNANLMLPGAGSWFVLGSVITTAPLPASHAPVADGCGSCRRCLDACPTGAIIAPGVVDARRCLSWVLQRPGDLPTDLRPAVGTRLYGCDDCQTACPPTVVFGRTRDRDRASAQRPDLADLCTSLPLVELLEWDDDAILAAWGRWYLADRDPRWVRRNAIVALGNALAGAGPAPAGDGAHRARARSVLAGYVDGIDPLLADHARWAIERAGSAGLA